MDIIKEDGSVKYIPIDMFNICKIDGLTRKEISKLYQRKHVTKHKCDGEICHL